MIQKRKDLEAEAEQHLRDVRYDVWNEFDQQIFKLRLKTEPVCRFAIQQADDKDRLSILRSHFESFSTEVSAERAKAFWRLVAVAEENHPGDPIKWAQDQIRDRADSRSRMCIGLYLMNVCANNKPLKLNASTLEDAAEQAAYEVFYHDHWSPPSWLPKTQLENEFVTAQTEDLRQLGLRAYENRGSNKPRPEPGNSPTQQKALTRRAFIDPHLEAKGWSVNEWAQHSNVDFHTAAAYLKGKTRPYPSTLKKLARSLTLNIQDMPE